MDDWKGWTILCLIFFLMFLEARVWLLSWRIKGLLALVRKYHVEHKKDALNLQEQIRSIEPNRWVNGKRPIPIRPLTEQELRDGESGTRFVN
jgi:hypothetical protein